MIPQQVHPSLLYEIAQEFETSSYLFNFLMAIPASKYMMT